MTRFYTRHYIAKIAACNRTLHRFSLKNKNKDLISKKESDMMNNGSFVIRRRIVLKHNKVLW